MNMPCLRTSFSIRVVCVLVILLFSPGVTGCTWWEKNVSKKVEGITQGRLTITSDPPGADVFVDDVYQGKTPLTLTYKLRMKDIMKGLDVLVQKEGYLPIKREVSYQAKNLSFRLIRRR